jgi:3alpha(or 20beta)-hydroxysteroid dehydrogenase
MAAGRLEGHVALITGAASGMGEATARLFVAEGGKVVVADVSDDAGRKIAEELGANAHYAHLDVREQTDWTQAIEGCVARFGKIDTLVNNAGIMYWGEFVSTPLEDFRNVIAVNQIGVFLGIQTAAAPMMAAGRGSIINIASVNGHHGSIGAGAYAATKFAVRGMTMTAAMELAPLGIRVNTVCPGGIYTAIAQAMEAEGIDIQAQIARHAPIGRLGDPREIAEMVLFLASDASSYCTGADFMVDGGVTAAVMYDGRTPASS